ncbi:MAG: hypothetical protein PHD11_03820 [Bacteroidales bacterium]|nr:hypothetical protein [Bacteroidales bacterium]MDD4670341.1 hypothetical protein [Bacteroidales bacterium]
METVTKTRLEPRYDEQRGGHRVEVSYEKFIFSEEDKMRIVAEYTDSREPADKVVERYKLSSKQVLFNWMGRSIE